MPLSSDDLLARLAALGVATETRDHAPVLTVEEMMAECGDLAGAHTKNLFLRDNKKNYFLVSMLHDAALDMKALRPLIGAKGGLSFGSPEALLETLGVVSGAVSPFAAANDGEGRVSVWLQQELMAHEALNFHPLRNDRTTTIAPEGLKRFLADIGHAPSLFTLG